jgi:hypothetical protein
MNPRRRMKPDSMGLRERVNAKLATLVPSAALTRSLNPMLLLNQAEGWPL